MRQCEKKLFSLAHEQYVCSSHAAGCCFWEYNKCIEQYLQKQKYRQTVHGHENFVELLNYSKDFPLPLDVSPAMFFCTHTYIYAKLCTYVCFSKSTCTNSILFMFEYHHCCRRKLLLTVIFLLGFLFIFLATAKLNKPKENISKCLLVYLIWAIYSQWFSAGMRTCRRKFFYVQNMFLNSFCFS